MSSTAPSAAPTLNTTSAPTAPPTEPFSTYPDPLGLQTHTWAWIVAGFFTVLALIFSFHLIRQHLHKNHHSILRKHVIRILMMVPVYAIEGFLGLVLHKYSFYFVVARECYESFVIYAFLIFLISFLGGDEAVVKALEDDTAHPTHKHIFPLCCLKPWANTNGLWFYRCKWGDLQYVPVKLICAIIVFGCNIKGVYHDGKLSWKDAWPYVSLVVNASQMWALYCLVYFVHGAPEALKKINPVRKLLVIKGVVFFTFWQAIGISLLVNIGFIKRTDKWDVETVSSGLQNFLVCFEMFVASLLHIWAFPAIEPAVDYKEGGGAHLDHNRNKAGRLASSLNLFDVGKDVGKMIVHKSPKAGGPVVIVEEGEGGSHPASPTNQEKDQDKDKDKDPEAL